MTTTHNGDKARNETVLRQALGLPPIRTVTYDHGKFLDPCPTCGQWPSEVTGRVPPPPGPQVTDVVPDGAAIRDAVRMVELLVEVLDQRRPPKQLDGLVDPRVLRYLRAVPTRPSGLRGRARLLTVHPSQPHEGAVEVAGSIRLAGRRRAFSTSFELAGCAGGCARRCGSCDRCLLQCGELAAESVNVARRQ